MYLRHTVFAFVWLLPLTFCMSCSSDSPETEKVDVNLGGSVDLGSAGAIDANKELASETKTKKTARRFQPITLGGSTPTTTKKTDLPDEQKFDNVLEALKPLQIMLGDWGGVTNKKIGGFSSVETLDWVWDLQSNPAQPALVMKADKSRYYENARLTYLTDKQMYQLTLTNKAGQKRIYEGTFSVPLKKVPGDDNPNIMHSTYKLSLSLVEPANEKKRAQIILNQQNNNRYLFELYDLRGESYARFDTISTRRKGTSFAKSDSDYGSKTCVISGGLGTSQVTYQGKSFWVCCSGCRKAFDADPEKWIAKYEANKKKTANQ
ncbi:MAG: hypothetical protein K0U86_22025 [Planctomycetes bacterium]|nr:hypothetical protein [Planctomycetota bacterium]MCH9727587.1 hypothetical protein [Planctomycetota bacterium]MCH9777433.1 hypothetical protein [Planctomycetota bacterium]MDF1743277.1 hypothetical protein [Gimesia sp.]